LAIQLLWIDGSNNEESFILERSKGVADGPWLELADLPANSTTYLDQGLVDQVTYYYRVRARNGAGDSTYSNIARGEVKLVLAGRRSSATVSTSTQPLGSLVLVGERVEPSSRVSQPPPLSSQPEIKMSMWVSNDTLRPGDILRIRVRVENLLDRRVDYDVLHSGPSPFYVWVYDWQRSRPFIYDPDTYSSYEYEEPIKLGGVGEVSCGALEGCDVYSRGTLEPRQVVDQEYLWDLTLPASSGAAQAPNGVYRVTASFGYGSAKCLDCASGTILSHWIQVSGSYDLINLSQAYDAVRELPAFKRWFHAHDGWGVARKYPNDKKYYVNIDGRWGDVPEEVYILAGQGNVNSIRTLTTESWNLEYTANYGWLPHRLVFRVDTKTNEIISVEPDLDAELEGGVLARFETPTHHVYLFTYDPKTIEQLFALQQEPALGLFPVGMLKPGPGPGLFNSPWSWHLDPENTKLSDRSNKECDGSSGFVEDALEYWLNTVGTFCPSSARLIQITDFRQGVP
jgi:hypothetical protein